MSYELTQIQLVTFLTLIDHSSLLKIASLVADTVPTLDAINPVILPDAEEAPPEFPRIMLQNESSGWSFRFAPLRYELALVPKSKNWQSEFEKTAIAVWDQLHEQFSAKSNRLGLLSGYVEECNDPVSVIRQGYLERELAKTEDMTEIQLHYLQKLDENDFELNCWTRIRSEAKVQDSQNIMLLIDVNTRTETPLTNVTGETVKDFLKTATAIMHRKINFHQGRCNNDLL